MLKKRKNVPCSLLIVCALMMTTGCGAIQPHHKTNPSIGAATHPPGITHQLVDLQELIPTLFFDLRYATDNNFTHKALYQQAKAYLHHDAAHALAAVHQALRQRGMGGLLIYDAYRPFHVQEELWAIMPDERYVSNPAKNRGRHTRGTSVDLTIVDAHGKPLPMPTGFDDFSEKAFRDYAGATAEETANRQILSEVMTKHGFEAYPYEWWHFDLKNWRAYPVLNISFAQLARGENTTIPIPDVPAAP